MLKVNDIAKLVQPDVIGKIIQVKFDENTGEKQILLEWTSNNEINHRWFKEKELEKVD